MNYYVFKVKSGEREFTYGASGLVEEQAKEYLVKELQNMDMGKPCEVGEVVSVHYGTLYASGMGVESDS